MGQISCAVYTTAQVDVHLCFIISCKDHYFQAFNNLLKLHSLYESLRLKNLNSRGTTCKRIYVLIQKEFAPLTYTQSYRSCNIRKPAFCICESKDADPLHGHLAAVWHLCLSIH